MEYRTLGDLSSILYHERKNLVNQDVISNVILCLFFYREKAIWLAMKCAEDAM